MNFQPVIVVGAGRSGTNMLRDLLAAVPGATTWPCDEINPVWKHGNLDQSDALSPGHARPEVRAFIRRAFAQRAQKDRADIVIEKTCANSLRVGFVHAVVPEAKIVHLVRDGRDVTLSAMRRWRAGIDLGYTLKKVRFAPARDVPQYGARFLGNRLRQALSRDGRLATWGPTFDGLADYAASHPLDATCARQWQACVDTADAALEQLPQTVWTTVYYERLVEQPSSELKRLLGFLGIGDAGEAVERQLENVSAAGIGGWRQRMAETELSRVLSVAGPTLARHGYSLDCAVPPASGRIGEGS